MEAIRKANEVKVEYFVLCSSASVEIQVPAVSLL